jgi:glycosyltransferase involved in cell wall biosynthesis
MTFHGVLRIKNEARWVERVLRALQPMCGRIHVLDDKSTDNTVEICESIPGVTVYRTPFDTLDESRDRDFLLQKVIDSVPASQIHWGGPHIVCAIDGDEILAPGGQEILQRAVTSEGFVWTPQILYLWDREDQWRIDGVYGRFRRPSFFRLINRIFRYQRTPFGNGANFHCSSIPQELLHYSTPIDAKLLHLGYLTREDRLRKFEWYTRIDGGNEGEDFYRHMVQGDVPEIPATARLKHAGPLCLQPLPQ